MLASQLVVTLDGPLSGENMVRLNALWAVIAEYGRNLQDVPLSESQGRLNSFKVQIMETVRSDPNVTMGAGTPASPSATTTPAPGSTPTPSPPSTGG
ncbi:hypothetical protein [Arthrobacter sp. ISL-69]|uniref:hypothetical protein n=1 Tax=Arthrobacter sp. ISL-69 TaxID=2819113 RepID=UPI002034E816|nr:hypothetical protein [Arthrobacter sp. ISL-69]